jgi:hypothetical protein
VRSFERERRLAEVETVVRIGYAERLRKATRAGSEEVRVF